MTLEKNRKRNRVRFLTPKKEPMKEPRKELIQEPKPKNRTESENLAPPSYTYEGPLDSEHDVLAGRDIVG